MSTSASSLNWWYIDGSRLRISSAGSRVAMSRKTPPCGLPRPALTSELIARATSSRGSSSGGRRLLSGSVYQRSRLLLGLRVLLAEDVGDVVEHEPLALGVLQHAAVTADRLGDQDALDRRRPDHAGRVELQELHVDQRRAGPQGERVPVAGVLPGVRGHLVGLADAAGGQHDRRRLEQHELAGLAVVAERAGDPPVAVQEQLGDRGLGEDPDPGLVVAGLARSPPAAARRSSAAGCGSAPGRCGRRRAPAAGTRGRRSCAGRSCRPWCGRTARRRSPAPRSGPAPPWRAARPSGSC